MGSKNFTTYKLMVKDADPITIIEANKEINPSAEDILTNRRSDIDLSRKTFVDANSGEGPIIDQKTTVAIEAQPLGMTVTDNLPAHQSEGTNRDTDGSDNGLKKLVYSPILLKKFVKEYAEKLKNADVSTKNAIKEISEKINQSGNIGSINANSDESAKHDEIEEKYNYNAYDRRRPVSTQPYKDRDGWVTLEAVPWSSSTVSKWHGNHNNHNHHDDDRDRPGSYSTFNDRLYSINSHNTHRPASYHHEEEEFYRPKPYATRPIEDDRPAYTAWSKPQAFSRPARPVHGSYSAFNDRDDVFERPYGKPWAGDIITDSRPSNFPRPHRRPGYNDAEPYSNDEDERFQSSSGHSDSQHPVNGNGEWVLISTTKGYQVPGRRQSGRRSLKFSVPSSMDTTRDDIHAHKSVKLTVLPALKSNSTFSSDPNKTGMVTSHGGMLEVESTQQTIEAAVSDAKKQAALNKQPTKAPAKDKNKRKVVRGNWNK